MGTTKEFLVAEIASTVIAAFAIIILRATTKAIATIEAKVVVLAAAIIAIVVTGIITTKIVVIRIFIIEEEVSVGSVTPS